MTELPKAGSMLSMSAYANQFASKRENFVFSSFWVDFAEVFM